MGNLRPASTWCLTLITALPKPMVIATLVLVFASGGWAQTNTKYCCEGYVFIGGRTTRPSTASGGVGGEIFIYHGLGVGGDVGATLNNPDGKLTMGMGYTSYHFLCCGAKRRVEPFVSWGVGFLDGDINTFGRIYYNISGPDRIFSSPGAGVTLWPAKRLGVRFEVRRYAYKVTNGSLLEVTGPSGFTELRVAFALR